MVPVTKRSGVQHLLHAAVASLALFLAGATVASELAAPLWAVEEPLTASGRTAGEQEAAFAYVEAIFQRNELTAAEGNASEAERCTTVRTLKTTYRPVVLLDRTEGSCGAAEFIRLELTLGAHEAFQVTHSALAICPATSYTMTSMPGGDRLSAVSSLGCRAIEHHPLPATGHRPRAVGVAVVGESDLTEPGLHVVCAAARILHADGSVAIVEDLTWFEVWSLTGEVPERPAHLQSTKPDTPCTAIGLPFEHGLVP